MSRGRYAKGKSQWPPRPGNDGTYRDTCIVCMRGTDTVLAFRGEANWLAAGLVTLGVPMSEALHIVGQHPDYGRQDYLTMQNRVCARCVAEAKPNFPAPVLAIKGAKVPLVAQHAFLA